MVVVPGGRRREQPATAGAGDLGRRGGPPPWGLSRAPAPFQVTYDGHPLYTTTADTGPGQAKGDGVWSHGGEWHEVTVTVPDQAD